MIKESTDPHANSVALGLIDATHFQFLRSSPFPSFSEVVSYICNTVRLHCHILHPFLRSPNLLNDFFKVCIQKAYSLCCEVLWVLANAECHVNSHNITWNNFITLKNLLGFIHSMLSASPQAPDNH